MDKRPSPGASTEPGPNEWRPIATAPMGERVLVWGSGPVRFGYRDALGQWRKLHHQPMAATPAMWMPLPEPPRG